MQRRHLLMAGVAFYYLGAHLVWDVREWMSAFHGRSDMFFIGFAFGVGGGRIAITFLMAGVSLFILSARFVWEVRASTYFFDGRRGSFWRGVPFGVGGACIDLTF